MLVNINGDIIETKNIYKISPIRYEIIKSHDWTSDIRINELPPEYMYRNHFEFNILFFNNVTHTVYLSRKPTHSFKKEDVIEQSKVMEDDITRVREELIKYWNSDKNDVPEIKFNHKDGDWYE